MVNTHRNVTLNLFQGLKPKKLKENYGTRRLRLYFNESHSYRIIHWCNIRLYFRIVEHREKKYPDSFTAKYNCSKLVYYEQFDSIEEAIAKEKQLKNWRRAWKINLINQNNPNWEDLFETLE
ncbi:MULTISPECIES: GIY-YIG nuclease family protein [unclassified Pedobacter]|uniref:GIY-YIG nuclease family protein n=1 Tax=unclassified Pedobacter TaxID=2628915 RepID=UPI0020352DA4|nr:MULTISPECIES: GIY-YIG nuclease family protein [unclassified Pedobacter]